MANTVVLLAGVVVVAGVVLALLTRKRSPRSGDAEQERFAGIGLLSSGLAHELNNPLQAILGAATLLERDDSVSVGARREIDTIKQQTIRAREIVRSLARFGGESGTPTAVRLGQVVAKVLASHGRGFVSSPFVIRVRDESSRSVFADAADLEQVTMHLVRNAQHAIERAHARVQDGRITICIRDAGTRVRLEIADNGPAVRADDEDKLFLPFFTTRQVGQGSGLGLAVSYGIIRSFGGRLGYLRNEAGGATFFLELPAIDATAPAGPIEPTLVATR
jgi:C4-dicarboxylate-specific signal transduction histidine kinase